MSEPIRRGAQLAHDQADVLRRGIPLGIAPLAMDLQARVQTLEHLVAMDAMAFQLIAEHPEQAPQIAAEALAIPRWTTKGRPSARPSGSKTGNAPSAGKWP